MYDQQSSPSCLNAEWMVKKLVKPLALHGVRKRTSAGLDRGFARAGFRRHRIDGQKAQRGVQKDVR